MEQESVSAWHAKEKVRQTFAFNKRDNLPNGWKIMGTTVSLNRDNKNKLVRENLCEFDAVEMIHDKLNDGDSVYISGEVQFSEYEKDNEVKHQTKYIVKNVSLTANKVDFEDEKFEETCSFEQEVVISGTEWDKETKKLYLTAMTIQYGDKFSTGTFVVDGSGDSKLATNMKNKLKFGDFIKLYGLCVNSVVTEEVEDIDEFGGVRPKGFNSAVKSIISELRVVGVESSSYEPKKYKDSDFVVETTPESETTVNPFKKKGSDDFGNDVKDTKKKNTPQQDNDDDDDSPFK